MTIRIRLDYFCPECRRTFKSIRRDLTQCKLCRSPFTDNVTFSSDWKPRPPPIAIDVGAALRDVSDARLYFSRYECNDYHTIIVPLLTVAAPHFYIAYNGRQYEVHDIFNDYYPTRINGRSINVAPLTDGDRLEFGGLSYRFSKSVLSLDVPCNGAYVAAQGLSCRYRRGPTVFSGVSFSVKPGEFVGIYGESGCGKSTLLKRIAQCHHTILRRRVAPIDDIAGTLQIASRVDTALPRVSYIPQDACLLNRLTVRETFDLFAALHNMPDRSLNIMRLLCLLGLYEGGVRNNAIEKLSGGQRKRVNMGVGLLSLPDILLIDEPDANLDRDNRFKTMMYLASLRLLGSTVLATVHNHDVKRFFDASFTITEQGVRCHDRNLG